MKKLILILSIFLLTGCYDYVELDEMKLVSSIIVDYQDGEYKVNLELLNASKEAEFGSQFIDAEGSSFEDALNNARNHTDADPYYGHMSSLFISKDFAEEGIESILDFLARNVDIRKDFYIFLTDNVDSLTEYESNSGESLGINVKKNYLRSLEKNGKYKTCNLRELLRKYLRDQVYIIGALEVEDNQIELTDSFVFMDNKIDLQLEEDVSLLVNLMEKNTESFLVNGKSSYEIHEYKFEVETKENKVILNLSGSGRVKTAQEGAYTYEDMEKSSKDVSNKMKMRILDIIEYCKRADLDILGISNAHYQHYPKLADKNSWKELEYEVKVDILIGDKGMVMSTLEGEKDGR